MDEVEDGGMGGYRGQEGDWEMTSQRDVSGEVARLLLENRMKVSFSGERYWPSLKDVIFGDLCVRSLLCCDGTSDSASSQCLAPLAVLIQYSFT